jgi:hypothetical protein
MTTLSMSVVNVTDPEPYVFLDVFERENNCSLK